MSNKQFTGGYCGFESGIASHARIADELDAVAVAVVAAAIAREAGIPTDTIISNGDASDAVYRHSFESRLLCRKLRSICRAYGEKDFKTAQKLRDEIIPTLKAYYNMPSELRSSIERMVLDMEEFDETAYLEELLSDLRERKAEQGVDVETPEEVKNDEVLIYKFEVARSAERLARLLRREVDDD